MSSSNIRAWLAPDFLNWHVYSEGGSVSRTTPEMFNLPHSYVEHASKRFASSSSDLDRADSINNLKKALYHRVEALNDLYQLDKFSYLNLPKNRFKRLESLNLLKPIMSKQLADLRAEIEHKHISPPPIERCNELAEYVWYFLRSTDPFIRVVRDNVVFNRHGFGCDNGYWVSFIYAQEPEKSREFVARLPEEQVSLGPKDDWLEVEIENKEAESDLGDRLKGLDIPISNLNEGDFFWRGTLVGPLKKLILFRQRYFEVY